MYPHPSLNLESTCLDIPFLVRKAMKPPQISIAETLIPHFPVFLNLSPIMYLEYTKSNRYTTFPSSTGSRKDVKSVTGFTRFRWILVQMSSRSLLTNFCKTKRIVGNQLTNRVVVRIKYGKCRMAELMFPIA